jgi:hypothetical protein
MGTNDVPTVADGAEPPYHHEMDRRLTVLETRFDTLFPTLATKSDLEALRSEVRAALEKMRGDFRVELEKMRGEIEKLRADQLKMHNDFMKWIIGLVISLFIAVIGFDIAIFNAVSKGPPAGLAPAATAAQRAVPLPPIVVPQKPNLP